MMVGMRLLLSCLVLCLWSCTPAPPPTKPDPCKQDPASCKPPEPKTVAGCDGARFLVKPADPAKAGPWAVGARTIELPYVLKNGEDASYTIELWYPAAPGSQKGKEKLRYDLRKQLPPDEQGKIPDAENPWQACECYRDLPLDADRGPYPAMLFIHGTGGFRTQSLAHMVHWASRGFVVVAADHPGIKLGDVLQLKFAPKQAHDASFILDAMRNFERGFAFLKGHMDVDRMALSGHSAGGNALAGLGGEKGVKVLIPMAASGVSADSPPQSTLILGAKDDQVVPYKRQSDGYDSSPKKKRLVGIDKAGHLAFSDLCVVGKDAGGLIEIAIKHKVKIPENFKSLLEKLATDGCKQGQLDPKRGWDIVHFATSAVLEESLHCDPAIATSLQNIQTKYPEVFEFKEEK